MITIGNKMNEIVFWMDIKTKTIQTENRKQHPCTDYFSSIQGIGFYSAKY